jgi:hypothetical protein
MNTKRGPKALGLLLGLTLASTAVAAPATYESPVARVAVLELYTSHGCSSCPPADRWLRTLVDDPGLWRRIIPLAFHVDYWDGLGWADRFARPEFSDRQWAYYRSGALQAVYTPGFVLNGKEWRGRFAGRSPEDAPGEPEGQLHLTVEPGAAAALSFNSVGTADDLEAHLAVLGFGLSSRIGGGENAGKTLTEDFVVLGTSMTKKTEGGPLHWQLPWPHLKMASPTRRAVVAWVSEPGNPRPIQAVGGWLPR